MQNIPSSEPALDVLRETFVSLGDHAYLASDDELSRVRAHVCAVVRDLKAAGELPEAIIITIRRMALEAGIGASADRLLGSVVTWCLHEYFHAS